MDILSDFGSNVPVVDHCCFCKNVLHGLPFFSFLYVLRGSFFEWYSCHLTCHSQNQREIIYTIESVLICHPIKNIPPVSTCKVIIKLHTGIYFKRCTAYACGRSGARVYPGGFLMLSLIHISEPTRRTPISYA